MNRLVYLACFLMFQFGACSGNDDDAVLPGMGETRAAFTYSGETDGVTVISFDMENESYYYDQTFTPVWSGNKADVALPEGKYQFLFYKSATTNVTFENELRECVTRINDIYFQALPDLLRDEYVLPVDELWLPESIEMAEQVHVVTSGAVISNRLTRAVSKVDVQLKRGEYVNDGYEPIPFDEGENINQIISSLNLDINGVGSRVNYTGSYDIANTYFTLSQPIADNDGFALYEGPFVYPSPEGVNQATIHISLLPADSSSGYIDTVVTGKLERNKKLLITLWMSVDHKIINITYDVSEITAVNDGDSGIWE